MKKAKLIKEIQRILNVSNIEYGFEKLPVYMLEEFVKELLSFGSVKAHKKALQDSMIDDAFNREIFRNHL